MILPHKAQHGFPGEGFPSTCPLALAITTTAGNEDLTGLGSGQRGALQLQRPGWSCRSGRLVLPPGGQEPRRAALVVLTPGQQWSWIWQVLCHQGPLKREEDRESVRSRGEVLPHP